MKISKGSSQYRRAFAVVARDADLTAADRAHLQRWQADDWAENTACLRLAKSVEEGGVVPAGSSYRCVIEAALATRRYAESIVGHTDPALEERKIQRAELFDLAEKADALARYFESVTQYSGIAMFFMRFLKPLDELIELHRKEAQLLRQRAGRAPKPSIRVRRQDRHKGRKGLRKLSAFIEGMDGLIRDLGGTSDHEALAVLADLAFPGFDVDADQVRKTLYPTTRAGRALMRKKRD